jgi:beta-mannosidase
VTCHLNRPFLDLNGASWWFAFAEDDIPGVRTRSDLEEAGRILRSCRVPGNFELDLQAAGLIEEPFFGMNIAGLRRYETTHVWYGRRFDVSSPVDGWEPWLRLEGVDCFAEIFLNGEHIGGSDNMLVEHEFAVSGQLLPGENELLVHIRPAVREAQRFAYPPGVSGFRQSAESLYVRKAPHMFGWDIMPRALSAGLWRSVSLDFRPAARLDYTYLETIRSDSSHARLRLRYRARLPGADFVRDRYEITVEGVCGRARFSAKEWMLFGAGSLAVDVRDPRRWWPRGRGEPALYDVTVRLLKNGEPIDSQTFRHGIRTVSLRRTSIADADGSGEFCFLVNGERVFVHGSNWVPADAYHSRDRERIPRMIALAEEVGCNMLRCWGGNVYEDDLFYDLCDEKGILVWQDFSMACAVYPRDDDFAARLAAEATQVVRRLRHHACIVLWAGDNECDQAYNWMDIGDPNANRLTREVLPGVLRMEDGRRPYLPSSPYIDPLTYEKGPQYATEDHLWGPRDYFKSAYYHNALCHFASEIGYHGCPSPDSVRRFISADRVWPPDNEEWILHATSPIPGANLSDGLYDQRIQLMSNQVREMFGVIPDDLETFALASQVVQAEAKKHFVEMFRSAKWRRTGILWWNLIDGWPQFSDAVVDYYFSKKLAFYYLRRVQQPLCLMLREPRDWKQEVVVCNNSRDGKVIEYVVRDVDREEPVLSGRATIPGDEVTRLGTVPFFAAERRFYVLEWTASDGTTGRNHYLAGHPPFDLVTYRGWLKKAMIDGPLLGEIGRGQTTPGLMPSRNGTDGHAHAPERLAWGFYDQAMSEAAR